MRCLSNGGGSLGEGCRAVRVSIGLVTIFGSEAGVGTGPDRTEPAPTMDSVGAATVVTEEDACNDGGCARAASLGPSKGNAPGRPSVSEWDSRVIEATGEPAMSPWLVIFAAAFTGIDENGVNAAALGFNIDVFGTVAPKAGLAVSVVNADPALEDGWVVVNPP